MLRIDLHHDRPFRVAVAEVFDELELLESNVEDGEFDFDGEDKAIFLFSVWNFRSNLCCNCPSVRR